MVTLYQCKLVHNHHLFHTPRFYLKSIVRKIRSDK